MHKTVDGRTLTILLIASCCAGAALLYARGMDNYFVSDDWGFLFAVSGTHTLSDASRFLTFDTRWFVRPTQLIATWLVYQIAGPNPPPFHLASAAIDFANATLLAVLVWQLPSTDHPSSGRRTVRTIATAALFLFSWRHHEVVFWYSSVNELLATFFRLSSLLLILCSVRATTRVRGAVAISAALVNQRAKLAQVAQVTFIGLGPKRFRHTALPFRLGPLTLSQSAVGEELAAMP